MSRRWQWTVVVAVAFLGINAVDAYAASSSVRSCHNLQNRIARAYRHRQAVDAHRTRTIRADAKLAELTRQHGERCLAAATTICTDLYLPVCGSTKQSICHDSGGFTCLDSYAISVKTYPNMCALLRAGATYMFDGEC